MRVIAVIEHACAPLPVCVQRTGRRSGADRRPAVVWQILDHLGLPTIAPSFRVPPHLPREWSYEPLFDLPVRRTQTGDLPVPDPVIVQRGLRGRSIPPAHPGTRQRRDFG
jgi:hypothetical protein